MVRVVHSCCKQTYPPEDWLSRGALLSDFDAEAITALAQQLKPQHVRYVS